MKNTIEALDQFAEAIGPMLPAALDPPAPQHPDPAPAPAAATAPAAGATVSQPAATSRDGITRPGRRGDAVRRARLALLALGIALGLPHVVRAAERAAVGCWRQAITQSLAAAHASEAHTSGHGTAPHRPG